MAHRSYARRRFRASLIAFISETKQIIAIFVTAALAIVVIALVAEPSRFIQGFMIGSMITVLIAFFLLLFLMATGSVLTLAGIWAERFTNDELAKTRKRGYIWGSVANIELGGFDIDHLVIAPGGMLSLETKAHMAQLDQQRLAADLKQARDAARKASLVLRSKHIEAAHDVLPVLVLWGRRSTRELPDDGVVLDGVQVLAVSDLARWLERFKAGRVAEDHAAELLRRLAVFRDSRVVRAPALT